jgi:adenosylhomocysteine nucleosidase
MGGRVHVSGPGGERAARAARAAIADGAEALVSFGLAGGLVERAANGTVILPVRVIGDGETWTTDAAWRQRLVEALGAACRVLEGTLCSVARTVTEPEAKVALAAATGADAVDMESAAVARVATAAGRPFVAVRVVADGPADALPPNVEKLVTDDGRTRLAGLLPMLVSPRQLARLIALGRQSERAREVLRQVAAILTGGAR